MSPIIQGASFVGCCATLVFFQAIFVYNYSPYSSTMYFAPGLTGGFAHVITPGQLKLLTYGWVGLQN
jgi:hypothetical protein